MKKELRQLYGGRKPKGYLLAHNHITHTPDFPLGANGFRRFWIPPQWVGQGWSECPCGWRPDHVTHSALTTRIVTMWNGGKSRSRSAAA